MQCIKKGWQVVKSKAAALGSAVAIGAASVFSTSAMAVYAAQDYSSIGTAWNAEVTAAMPFVMALAAFGIGVGIAFKLFKRGKGMV